MINYADAGVAPLTGRIVATSARCFKDGERRTDRAAAVRSSQLWLPAASHTGGAASLVSASALPALSPVQLMSFTPQVATSTGRAQPCVNLLLCCAGLLGVADKLKNPEASSSSVGPEGGHASHGYRQLPCCPYVAAL